jgi:GAF domain-containing protein
VHAGREIPTHAAYAALGLEAYRGTPLHIDGELFGTLSFARALPREHAFTDIDVDSLMLMDSWLETEIQRRRAEEALEEATRRLEQLVITDPVAAGVRERRSFASHDR